MALAGKVHLELVRGELMKVSWWFETNMGVSLNGGTPKTPRNDHF